MLSSTNVTYMRIYEMKCHVTHQDTKCNKITGTKNKRKKVKVIASSDGELKKVIIQAKCHYTKAIVDDIFLTFLMMLMSRLKKDSQIFLLGLWRCLKQLIKNYIPQLSGIFRAEDMIHHK
ncbi:hypothetical protein L1987_71927 [Smallanthus sonchifolius]|uniref:Uncharacterized protein n=1 Tax=Smallanthus sonchifolius TaxID=185202 RepID=A0ACB9AY53_9ASTR|nr:hypothetical protein L1987_71927 [Smallanthus sonchifolius]